MNLIIVVGLLASVALSAADEEKKCKPFQKWKDGPNYCYCTEHGLTACITMVQQSTKFISIAPQWGFENEKTFCIKNQPFKLDCNNCTCNSEGDGAHCTTEKCDKALGYQNAIEGCKEGQWVSSVCDNVCKCTSEGKLKCTQNQCSFAAYAAVPEECKDGEVKKVECNTCHCMNGKWGCTRMMCLSEVSVQTVKEDQPKTAAQ